MESSEYRERMIVFMNLKSFLLLALTLMIIGAALPPAFAVREQPVNRMTPYDSYVSPDTFLNGAVLDLKKTGDVGAFITRELENMRYCYNINTINVYGLEGFDTGSSNANKDKLFAELRRLGMKVIVRIEAYNASSFAFQDIDLDYVFNTYNKLIEYVSAAGKREQVAYFSLNMPVDDGRVHQNLGGSINSDLSRQRQVSYAKEFVARMREKTGLHGFSNAKMYLSIFYGWDNTYQVPSYASAGADGYFINNYSYPRNQYKLPGDEATDDELINATRLKISMDTFVSQYPGKPLVVECGFHTLEYNKGVVPNQTAGLVKDKAGKKRALKAVMNFYKTNYPDNFAGLSYFGYNLYKEEGSPAAVMDWSLLYPTAGEVEAETGYRVGNAVSINDEAASDGLAVSLSQKGDGLMFGDCASLNQFKLRYKAARVTKVGVYVDANLKQTLELSAQRDYADIFFSQTVSLNASITLKLEEGAGLTIDMLGAYEQLEAENSRLGGGAKAVPEDFVSNGMVVGGLASSADTITIENVRSGARLRVRYKAAGDSRISVRVNGKPAREMELKAAEDYTDMSIPLNVPAGSTLVLAGVTGNELYIDYIGLSGVAEPEESSDSSGTPEGGGLNPVAIVGVCLGGFLVILAAVTAVILLKNKKK